MDDHVDTSGGAEIEIDSEDGATNPPAVEATSEPEPVAHAAFVPRIPALPDMPTPTDDLAKDFGRMLGDLLEDTAKQIGRDFKGDLEAVRAHTALRMAHLATVAGEPGFAEALQAEKDSILLRAAGHAVQNADTVDRRLHSIVETALLIGSRALMGLPA